MARPQVTKYVVDTDKAVKAVDKLSTTYKANAQSLGFLTKEFAIATKAGKSVTSAFTQINSAGQAVTTTVNQTKKGIQNYSVTVQQATEKQLRFVETQKALLAATRNAQAAFQPIVLNRQNKDQLAAQFGLKGNPLQAAIKAANAKQLATNVSVARGNAALGGLFTPSPQPTISFGLVQAQQAAERLKGSLSGAGDAFERLKNIGAATLIYRGLSLIFQGFGEATGRATEFEKKIGLIQTLAEGSGVSFSQWSTEIRKVSDDLGLPIVDVATAAYEGLSSQVIQSTKDFDVLTASLKLAKLTESDSVTALNVVASAINGFKKSSSEAEDIASKLFTTIDLGNVKVDELGKTMGRASALASLTGSSLEEVLASVAVLTQTGIDSAESITLLNNVFVQLTKPSTLLKEKLKELGFQTGEQAVSTLTLIGTIRELGKVSKDVPNGLAGLFPDIRGLRGAQSLLNDSDKFVKALDQINNSAGRVNRQFADLQKNRGDKFQSELERIKTFFTTDVGQKFLDTVVTITERFGGLSNVVKGTTKTVLVLGTAAIGLKTAFNLSSLLVDSAKLIVQFNDLRNTVTATGAIFNLFGPAGVNALSTLRQAGAFAAAFAAGYVVVDTIIKKSQETQSAADRANVESAKRALAERVAAQEKANADILKSFDKNIQEQRGKIGKLINAETLLMTEAMKATEKTGKAISDNLSNAFSITLSVLRKNVSETERAYDKATDAIDKIREVQDKVAIERSEQFVNKNIRLAELERDRFIAATGNKQKAYADYIRKITTLAESRIAFTQQRQVQAINKNDITLAEQLNSEIRSILTTLQDETVEVNGVTRPLLDQQNIQNRISFEADRFNKLLKDRVPILEKEAAEQGKLAFKEKARAKQIEDLLENASKFSEKVVKDGALTEEFAGNPQKAIEQLRTLQDEAKKAIAEVGGLKGQQTLENLGVGKEEISKQFGEQLANLQKEINLAQQATALRQVTEAQQNYGEVARKTLTDINEKIKEQIQLFGTSRVNLLETTKSLQGALDRNLSSGTLDAQKRQLANSLSNQLRTSIDSGETKKAIEQFTQLKRIIDGLSPRAQGTQVLNPFDLTNKTDLISASNAMKEMLVTMDNIQNGKIQELQAVSNSLSTIDPTNLQSVEKALTSIYASSANFQGIAGLEKSKATLLEIIDLLEKANRLKAGLPASSTTAPGATRGKVEGIEGGVLLKADGGFIGDFLSGRFRKGTDTIPAMLTRGEFVVREPMAQKYASLLTAINSNRAPIYRSEGTPSGSTSVGNIYVTMPPGSTAGQVRAFANAVRRGVKQGTINLGH